MREIGIGTWPFGAAAREPIPLPLALDRIVTWGYSAVDYGALPPHPTAKSGTEEVDLLRDEFAKRSLKVTALAPAFDGLSLLRPSDNDEYFERFLEQVALCKTLGCSVLRVDTIDNPEAGTEIGASAAIDRIASIWSRCAESAAAYGVTVGWEFEPCCVLNTPREICTLVSELDVPGFGVLFDTAHAHMVAVVGARHMEPGQTLPGGQAELIETLAGRIVHIHVLDSDGSLNDSPGTTIHTPIGQGNIDFASVIPPLAAIAGVRWTIDLCFWDDPAGVAATSRVKLDELLDAYAPLPSGPDGDESR